MSDMHLVFLLLGLTVIGFLVPKFRPDLVALTSLLAMQLTGLLSVQEAFAGFANSVVIMIAALFIVGEGIFQTGLAQRAGNTLLHWTGNSEVKMTLFMLVLVALLSGFISNTGTVAILMPVVVSLCRQMELHPGKLLMPLAFASSMGGALTLIGTAPNLIARQSLMSYGYEPLSFFSFTPVGLVILISGITYLWFLGRRFLDKPLERSKEKPGSFNIEDLMEQYQINKYIHPLIVGGGGEEIGKTLRELEWPTKYGITVLEVIKKEATGRFPLHLVNDATPLTTGPNYTLEVEDILLVYGAKDKVENLAKDTALEPIKEEMLNKYSFQEFNIAEVILTPQSRLINQTIKDVHFRDKYGLSVLAIKHQDKEPRLPLLEQELSYGDALLVYGKWKDINLLSKERRDLVVLRHAPDPEIGQGPAYRPLIAGLILGWMLIMLVLEWLPAVITVVIAALLMILTGSVRQTDEAYRSINWQTVILIASMLPMATALEKTGGVQFISNGLISSLGNLGPLAVLAGLYITTSLFSQFISNTATAVLLFPVAILTAQQMEISPIPMVMAVAFSASMAFATPVATPPNAMVMVAGKYSFFDFVRVGVPLQILIAIIAVLILPLYFPF